MKKILYHCPECRNNYETEAEAIQCVNQKPEPKFEVGEIVFLYYRYGWFDGSRDWVMNPDILVDTRGKGEKCLYGFYYVITDISIVEHELRYTITTLARKGAKEYHAGWTTDTGSHYRMNRVNDPPKVVVEQSKKLIGIKSHHLI